MTRRPLHLMAILSEGVWVGICLIAQMKIDGSDFNHQTKVWLGWSCWPKHNSFSLLHLLHLPLYCNDLRHSLWHSAWPFTTERKQPLTLNNLPLPHTRVHTHRLKGYHWVLGSRASSIDGSKTKGNKLLCLMWLRQIGRELGISKKDKCFFVCFPSCFPLHKSCTVKLSLQMLLEYS